MPAHRRAFPNNLPLALSSFIGRGREIVALRQVLVNTRLATLTGPGGSGKTRLALWVAEEVGSQYPDGAWFVALATVADPALVTQTVAVTLGLHEQPGRAPLELLREHLAERELLLVLDNCEQVLPAAAALAAALLSACPDLRLLATSREPLNVDGETVWPVPALSLPPAEALPALLQSEAARLFIERAAAADPNFSLTAANAAAVAQICRLVDGLPLAVELAAARVRALTVEQIAERLAKHEGFHLLNAGRRTALPHQQTLAATLAWSYDLLDDAEQRLLRGLAVFNGGWTLEAVEAVAGEAAVLETLTRLVNKSLVVSDQAGAAARYRLLATIRQYAAEQLEQAGEAPAARDRHLAYFAGWAEAADAYLGGTQQLGWLARYQAELANLRSALDWAVQANRAADGLRLAVACARFWRITSLLTEGRDRLTSALAVARASTAPYSAGVLADALFHAGRLAYLQSDYAVARAHFDDCLALAHTLGPAGQAVTARATVMLGEIATEAGDYASALGYFERGLALWRALAHPGGVGEVLIQWGWAEIRLGDYAAAEARLTQALAAMRAAGDSVNTALVLAALGEVALRQGADARALPLLEASLADRRAMGDQWGVATVLGSLGWVALRQGDRPRMRAAMAESLTLRRTLSDKGGSAWCLEKLAEAATLSADPAEQRRAGQVYAAAAAVRASVQSVIDPVDQPDHERRLAALRATLGPATFATAWDAGARLPLDAATALALAEPSAAAAPPAPPAFGGLSRRERQVAALLAQGRSNRQIAAALVVGERTAETYISRILNKLGFSSRVQIATWALEHGLAAPDDDA